jgi:hypothetical protein
LVNSLAGGEQRRVGAELPDGALPHLIRGSFEEQSRVDVCREPRGRGELFIQLARTPARVAGEHARSSRRALDHRTQHVDRAREIQAIGDRHDIAVLWRFAEQDVTALRLDGTSHPEERAGRRRDRGIEAHRFGCRRRGRTIHDKPERAFRAVLAEQHDRPFEVRIGELRHRQEQGGGEGAWTIHFGRHDQILAHAAAVTDYGPCRGP